MIINCKTFKELPANQQFNEEENQILHVKITNPTEKFNALNLETGELVKIDDECNCWYAFGPGMKPPYPCR